MKDEVSTEDPMTLLHKFSIIWAAISALLVIRLLSGAFWLTFRLRKAQPLSALELDELLSSLRSELRVPWQPKVVETLLVECPCLFGFFRPKLLLPAGCAERLTKAELRHVFRHELAHLKRGDL